MIGECLGGARRCEMWWWRVRYLVEERSWAANLRYRTIELQVTSESSVLY